MYITSLTRRTKSKSIGRRKGGGGGGKTSGGSGSTGEAGGSSTSSSKGQTPSTSGGTTTGKTSSTAGKTTTVPLSGSQTASGKTSATAYGYGGGKSITIPSGQLFAGRTAGGGTRDQIYGTSTYGSGYPGISGRGVYGRGFPFWFWPIVWSEPKGTYLCDPEYGQPSNTSRVGGPMVEATFISNSTAGTTFHVLSDNSTVFSLINTIDANCSSYLSSSSSKSPEPYNSSAPGAPEPEQAVQYYRSSSIVLTLDGYNNSATLSNDTNTPDTPLPSGIDTTLLVCLNQTIALSAILVSSANTQLPAGSSSVLLFGMVWLVWWTISLS